MLASAANDDAGVVHLSHYNSKRHLFGNHSAESASKGKQAAVSADDHQLIAQCLEGRSAAFGELVSRYQDRLYNSVYRLLGDGEDARDVVQEAFLNAYQSLRSFKGESLFFTWLYRVAVNAAISYKRKQRIVARIGGAGPAEPTDPSEASRPEHAMEMAEEEKRVHAALCRLSPEH